MKRSRNDSFSDKSEAEIDSDYEPEVKKGKIKKSSLPKTSTKSVVKKIKDDKLPKAKTVKKIKSVIDNDLPVEGNKIKEKKSVNGKQKLQLNESLNDSLYGDQEPSWVPADVIARDLSLDWNVTNTTCQLLEAGNSLPFLARYRREATGGMGPDTLRQVKDSLEILKSVQDKAEKLLATVDKQGKMTRKVRISILKCQTLPEIEAVSAPFKTGSKATLAERARKLGLEEAAEIVLTGSAKIDLSKLVERGKKGKSTLEEVTTGVKHIIADILVHDPDTAENLRKLQSECHLVMESKRAKEKASDKNKCDKNDKKEVDPSKFENYFEFSCPCKYIKPHQVLAINRGESLKILSAKIIIPDWMLHQIKKFVNTRWMMAGFRSDERNQMVEEAVDDAYKRLITPLIQRQTRSLLTKQAEEASISVFLSNLRSLLLTPPHRNSTVLSIDPGFSHGCKLAVLSSSGSVLETAVIYPNFKNVPKNQECTAAGRKIIELINKHSISTIAIGNGTACRETEALVSDVISNGKFSGQDVRYSIVSEQGASIYSCSELASQEFPGMDTNVISAVSIGRRLQDPLSELVKIEPQHLGVGMYQHDVAQAKLKAALDEVVSECVSFVGVDINSCSEYLLRRVAGLNSARAKAIVEFRENQGDFLNREQLKKVKGIGEKVWTQCAGFIRVIPRSENKNLGKVKVNMLDRTQIHPESYSNASKVISKVGVKLNNLGQASFCESVKMFSQRQDLEALSSSMTIGLPTLQMILDALQQSFEYDFRAEFSAPLFKSGLTKAENVKVGDILSGRVNNVTHFGAFVDIGIGINGLVHTSKMKGFKIELGNRIEAKIVSLEISRKRIGLELIKVM